MTLGAALMVALFAQIVTGTGGETTPTKVRLELHARRDCTSPADLARRVAARSARIQVVDTAPISAQVEVRSPHAGAVIADLVLTSPGLAQAPRRFVARSCAEAMDGVALIIAVTLDPDLKAKAALGELNTALVAGAPAHGASTERPGAALPATPTSVPAKAPDVSPSPTVPVPLVVERPSVGPARNRARRRFGASAAAQSVFGPAPNAMPGVALYFLAELDRDGLWAPAIVLGAMHVWRSGLDQPGGTASFTLNAATLDACPMRVQPWHLLIVRPCGSALMGWLRTEGSNTPQSVAATRPFRVVGAAISAGFGSTIEVTARVGVGLTLVRDSYEFGAVFYRGGVITTSASIGVGVHWP